MSGDLGSWYFLIISKIQHVKRVYLKDADKNEALSCTAVNWIIYNVGQKNGHQPSDFVKKKQSCAKISLNRSKSEPGASGGCDGVSSDKTPFTHYCCLPI